MNFLWGGMIVIGILYGAVNGTMQEVADAALVSSKEAVTLCITMAGVMSKGAPGESAYQHEHHCECAGPWLGGDAGGIEGDGESGGTGGGEKEGRCRKDRGGYNT